MGLTLDIGWFSFYMIVTRMDTVYGIVLPNEVLAFIRIFQVAVSFGLEALTAPFECLQMGGYLWRLGFWMLVPPVVSAAASVTSYFCRWNSQQSSPEMGARCSGTSIGLPLVRAGV